MEVCSSGSTILYLYLENEFSLEKVSVCSHFGYYGNSKIHTNVRVMFLQTAP